MISSGHGEARDSGNPGRLRHPREGGDLRLRILAVFAVLVHLLALYLPGSPEPSFDLPGADKVVHVLLFGVPVWLLGRLTGRVWLVAGVFAAHAVASELVQHWFLPHRSGDPFDLVADLIGVSLAVLVLTKRGRADRPATPQRPPGGPAS